MTVYNYITVTNQLFHYKPAIKLHCVSKNDTSVAHYNFNAHQPILVIFGIDIAEKACYQMEICYPTLLTNVSALPGETRT